MSTIRELSDALTATAMAYGAGRCEVEELGRVKEELMERIERLERELEEARLRVAGEVPRGR